MNIRKAVRYFFLGLRDQELPRPASQLSEEAILKLEKKLRQPVVSNTTTAHEAGYLLGQAQVLRILRDGV